jgi:predicted DCC family thiol-disulfide oxidoreductase YuxK
MSPPHRAPGTDSDDRLAVYFDRTCGVCTDVARLLLRLDRGRRLRLVPLQRASEDAPDAPAAEALRATLHVRDARGRWDTGAAACIRIAERVTLLRAVALAARLPLVPLALEAAYLTVAANRGAISAVVGALARRVRRSVTDDAGSGASPGGDR